MIYLIQCENGSDIVDQEKVSKLIKEMRKKNNLTQKEFAKKYNVTYQAVSKWENAKNIPDIELLKKMSTDFNIDLEDILEGNYKRKKFNKMILVVSILLIFFIGIMIFINKKDDFTFGILSSNCADFNITGSIAYNEKKSSIFISDISYCGEEDKIKYKEYDKIECVLYEKNNDNEIAQVSYDGKKSITLDKFLKGLELKALGISKKCKNYSDNDLYLIIKASSKNHEEFSHKIPLSVSEDCK